MTSLAAATRVQRIDEHAYAAYFPTEWAIGSVPNGGYVTSCVLSAAKTHFESTLAAQKQPDCMILHLEFPRRTSVGKAQIVFSTLKLGRQTSTVHVSVKQDDRTEVVGYLTFADISAEKGITLPTAWRMTPYPPAVSSFAALAADKDPLWKRTPAPMADFRRASKQVQVYYPREGMSSVTGRGSLDHWLRLASWERFDNVALGFVVDVALQVTEGYQGDREALEGSGIEGDKGLWKLWYPTLVLNLELKRPLPDTGVEWLFTRVVAKSIQGGRMDLEVLVLDEKMELVALSHHVCMILSASRNLAARGQGEGAEKKDAKKEKGKL